MRTGRARTGVPSLVLRVALATVVVAGTTATLVATDADLTVASIALLLAVAAASVLGYGPGLAAAVESGALLAYYFTPPIHSFRIDQPDDVLALVAFVTVSVLVGATIARLSELRRRAEIGERVASLRLELTDALRAGTPVDAVLQRLARELDELFELASCSISAGADRISVSSPREPVGALTISAPPVELQLALGRTLQRGDQDTITGLADAVSTVLELERVDAEARTQQLRAELDRSRAGFLTAITHDLRTPLATIKAATAALLAPASPLDATERHELLEDTYAEAARLEGLVNKVLELTRIRTGALQPDPVAVAAADLVRLAVDRLGATTRGRTITLDLDPDLPAIHVDVLLMEHVLLNLLENAIVHDPSGSAIQVGATATASTLQLSVVDHGPGIPASDHERIFDEFARRRAPTDGPGTGLGLAIVRALVSANGGHAWCEDTPGGGATFILELPIDDEETT
jgi:two-component system, OmpR family, sensor histidine kinase KdpD